MTTFSLCMIVKNEENVLARCLDSLQGMFDEIVIVDTGSTDATKEIAAKYTDKVYDFQWIDDFSAARNYAFSLCHMDYIYTADADEVVDEANRRELINLKNNILPEIEIVQMWYINKHSHTTTENYERDKRPKLFKRLRTFNWIDPIHESVNLNPVLFDSDIEILHQPENDHSGRDFNVFEKAINRGVKLTKKLHHMYAMELMLAGKMEDFEKASNYFIGSIYDPALDDESRMESYCVLTRFYRLSGNTSEFFKYGLKNIVIKPCSEICFELGQYYQELGDYEEASMWYQNAISETEPILDASSQNKKPLLAMADCYVAMGENNEFLGDELLEKAEELRARAMEC